MRVLILSQYYDPEPVPKAGELARALHSRRHDVVVVTGYPNYPSGRLYEGFKLGIVRRERRDDIQIVRTFEVPYHGRNVFGRMLNYLSFVASAPLSVLFVSQPSVIYV